MKLKSRQIETIQRSFEDGYSLSEIARHAGTTEGEARVFLIAWCAEGCPGGFAGVPDEPADVV